MHSTNTARQNTLTPLLWEQDTGPKPCCKHCGSLAFCVCVRIDSVLKQFEKMDFDLWCNVFDKPFLRFITAISKVLIKFMRLCAHNVGIQSDKGIAQFHCMVFQG